MFNNRFRSIALLLCLLLFLASPAWATTYYVSSASGNDALVGTSTGTAWKTVGKVAGTTFAAGDTVCFKGGETWTAQQWNVNQAGASGNPVTYGTCAGYGSGYAILDENNVNNYCIDAIGTTAQYLTFTGFECEHALRQGITFQAAGGLMPGIVVQNALVQDNGPGCSNVTGACIGTDPGGTTYYNQLDFQDTGVAADGVHFINNVVKWSGGHNCLQVHYDTGAVLVQGNTVGPGCQHGFIDVKGIGSAGTQALIQNNVVNGGQAEGLAGASNTPGFYTENTANPSSNILWQGNVAYNVNIAMQLCPGGTKTGLTAGGTYKGYNNTFYARGSNSSGNPTVRIDISTCNGPNVGTLGTYSIDLRNNIFDGGASGLAAGTLFIDPFWSITEAYNNIGGAQGNFGYNRTLGANDQNAVNPLYVNASAANFQLQNSPPNVSPDINAGLSGLTANNNNMGAFGSSVPQPPPASAAGLIGLMPHGAVQNCGLSGTNLAAGGTSTVCYIQLPAVTDYPLSCTTTIIGNVTNTSGSTAAQAQLVVGVSNPYLGSTRPMEPYLGLVHIFGGITPTINLAASQSGQLVDMRIDAQVDDGNNHPGPAPIQLKLGNDGVNYPRISYQINNTGSVPINWATYGGYTCVPLLKCPTTTGCGGAMQ